VVGRLYDPSEVIGWITDYGQSSAWFTFLEDQALDDEQAAALVEQDTAKRVEMYWDIQQKIYDNKTTSSLFHNPSPTLTAIRFPA
jgi:ABC-type transport system substrate-binding protein